MTSPPSGAVASVEKHFFEGGLVQCQEEEVQEAVVASPKKRALPGLKIKIMRIIFGDSQDVGAYTPWGTARRSSHVPSFLLTMALAAGVPASDGGGSRSSERGKQAQRSKATPPPRAEFEPNSVRFQSLSSLCIA